MRNRLAEIRESKGLTQDELAERAGSTRQTIGRLERGSTRMSDRWMKRLGAILGVDPLEIMGGGRSDSSTPTDTSAFDPDTLNYAARTVLRNHVAETSGVLENEHVNGLADRIVQAYERQHLRTIKRVDER